MDGQKALEIMGLSNAPEVIIPQTIKTQYNGIDLNRYHSLIANSRNTGSTSGKYQFISTHEIIDVLAGHGWMPSAVQESRVIKAEKQGFQKHLVRFRKTDLMSAEVAPEIVLYNSHDATSSIQFSAGLFRFICLNGMVVGDSLTPTFKINHRGYTAEKVNDALSYMVNQLPDLTNTVETFRAIELTPDEQGIYAVSAGQLKYDPDKAVVDTRTLLRPYRREDTDNSLWTTFNRVQENMLKGRIRIYKVDKETKKPDHWTGRKARKVNNVSENIKLNKALWELTSKMAELKS
jgi:hypothetical protein